jgi:hypothetical protein
MARQSTTTRGAGSDAGSRGISRRRFLRVAGAAGIAGGAVGAPAAAAAQEPKLAKETLRPVVDAAALAITDEQLGKLAGAVTWARGELTKLREVETGLIGPAPVFLPAAPAMKGGDSDE